MESKTENVATSGEKPPVRFILLVSLVFLSLIIFFVIIAMAMKNSKNSSIAVGETAPEFELHTFDGEIINMQDLRGKVVVLNFWASWCNPCEQEAEDLQNVWLEYQESGDVVFLGVDYADTEPEALEYLERFNVTYPNGPDLKSSISHLYRVTGVPETFIIDRSGNLMNIKIGQFSSITEIKNLIDVALATEENE